MALYSDKVMDHFQNPRNVGKLDDADGIGEVGNAKCGDIMRMYIKVKDGVITDCRFVGGCMGNTQGVAALVKGMKVEEAISRLKGIQCGMRGTSCPDQLARALEQYQAGNA